MDTPKIESEQKIAIVTGASGGIGSAVAKKLIANGYIIYGTYNQNSGNENFRDLKSTERERIHMLQVDIRESKQIDELLKYVFDRHKKINGLVNNAGIGYGNLALMTKKEDLNDVFETNLFAQISCMTKAYRYLRKSSLPAIVNITSISAFRDDIGTLAYSTSKAALIQASRIIAREYASKGIRVNCVAPGPTNTQMLELMSKDAKQTQIDSSSLKRSANPYEIADVVAFLLSECSSYMTGQCIKVDGGQLC